MTMPMNSSKATPTAPSATSLVIIATRAPIPIILKILALWLN